MGIHNMKYRDLCSVELKSPVDDNTPANLRQRETFYCVPIPGQTAWAREGPKHAPLEEISSRPKRAREDTETMTADVDMGVNGPDNSETKCAPAVSSTSPSGFNLPLPWEGEMKGTRCAVLKIYGADASALRVMDIVEVIGVLHMDWIEYPEDWKTGTWGISYSCAPRLHAISTMRKQYFNPAPMIPDMTVSIVRDALLQYLKFLVRGDEVAARYLFFALIQREFKRLDDVSYGTFTLGLQLEDEHATRCTEGIRLLMPYVAVLPISIEALSTYRWFPKKNYETETVMSGLLQLAHGSVVVLDENALKEGNLLEYGLLNLASIQKYLCTNELQGDFEFYQIALPTYHSNIVLSASKKKPLLDPEVHCPVEPVEMDGVVPDADMLATFRSYLANCIEVSSGPMKFEEELVEQLPKDFSDMRQRNAKIPQSMCNIWTVLARINAISRRSSEISINHWQEILAMEEARMKRLE